MDFFIDHLEQNGYKVEVFYEEYFAYGKELLFHFSWDGVYVAKREGFDKWGNSCLNDERLPVPYTEEQLAQFWENIKALNESCNLP